MIVIKMNAADITISAQKLRNVHQRLLGLDAAYKKIGTLVFQFVQRQFQSSGAHGGSPWAPLKPATLAWKRKHGYSAKPLIRTGHLRQAWDIDLGKNKVTVRSLVDYSGAHQHGTRHLPARPMLPTEAQARELAVRTLSAEVRDEIARTLSVSVR